MQASRLRSDKCFPCHNGEGLGEVWINQRKEVYSRNRCFLLLLLPVLRV